jgi:small subunit ribosomal protein S20
MAIADLITDGFCWTFAKEDSPPQRLMESCVDGPAYGIHYVPLRRFTLATHKSAAKRARQTIRKNEVNRKVRSQVRTAESKIRSAISKKDKKTAEDLMSKFMSAVDKAAQKGVIHARSAARRISRVASQLSALGGK